MIRNVLEPRPSKNRRRRQHRDSHGIRRRKSNVSVIFVHPQRRVNNANPLLVRELSTRRRSWSSPVPLRRVDSSSNKPAKIPSKSDTLDTSNSTTNSVTQKLYSISPLPTQPQPSSSPTLEDQLRELALNHRNSFSSTTTSETPSIAGSVIYLGGLTACEEEEEEFDHDDNISIISLPFIPEANPLPSAIPRSRSSPALHPSSDDGPSAVSSDNSFGAAGSRRLSISGSSIVTIVPRASDPVTSTSVPKPKSKPKRRKAVTHAMLRIRRSISSLSLFFRVRPNGNETETVSVPTSTPSHPQPRTSIVIKEVSPDMEAFGSSYAQVLASLCDGESSTSTSGSESDTSSVIYHHTKDLDNRDSLQKSISEPRLKGMFWTRRHSVIGWMERNKSHGSIDASNETSSSWRTVWKRIDKKIRSQIVL